MSPAVSTLLLCANAESVCVICEVFNRYATDTEVCLNVQQAREAIQQRNFDLVVLDMEVPKACEMLRYSVKDHRGYGSVIIGITRRPAIVKQIAGQRVHLILQKPVTASSVEKTLKAAYSLIIKEKRSAFRHSVQIAAAVTIVECGENCALQNPVIQDISYTGLRLKADRSAPGPPAHAKIFVNFQIPDSFDHIHVCGKIVWSDPHGQVGIHFQYIPAREFQKLRAWLAAQCPWDTELPLRMSGSVIRPEVYGSSIQ